MKTCKEIGIRRLALYIVVCHIPMIPSLLFVLSSKIPSDDMPELIQYVFSAVISVVAVLGTVGWLVYLPSWLLCIRLYDRPSSEVSFAFASAQDRKSTRLNSSHIP